MSVTLSRVSTGVPGLDEVLHGGLVEGRSYIVRGQPGAGKTVLALEFLTATDDESLFVAFEEPPADVRANADALGMDVGSVEFLDLTADPDRFLGGESYDVFAPDSVEGGSVTAEIAEAVTEQAPDRVVLDPLTELRHLAPDDYQFRQEVASFVNYLKDESITAVFTTQVSKREPDDDLQFLADGTIDLRRTPQGRFAEVTKLRGSNFQSGEHTLKFEHGGIAVYPELVPRDHDRAFDVEHLTSGIDELDALLGGGIQRGTVTVLTGPSGVGKTTTGTHFLRQAATHDERAVAYLFEESAADFRYRSEQLGIPVEGMEAEGSLGLHEVEPLTLTPDEFAHRVRTEVEEEGARMVMVDGTAGYRLSLRGGDDDLRRELHALARYLKNMGVTVVLVEEQQTVTGAFTATDNNISYLADTILFLQYLEHRGEVRKAAGVLKKRLGEFERSLRSFEITDEGVRIGDKLTGLRGVLSGTPEWSDGD